MISRVKGTYFLWTWWLNRNVGLYVLFFFSAYTLPISTINNAWCLKQHYWIILEPTYRNSLKSIECYIFGQWMAYQAHYWPKHLTSKIYQTQLRVFLCKQLRNCTQWVFIYPTEECEASFEELLSRSVRISAFVEVQGINVFTVARRCTLHRTSWIDPRIHAHIYQVYFNL
jgi:hypothetical protein